MLTLNKEVVHADIASSRGSLLILLSLGPLFGALRRLGSAVHPELDILWSSTVGLDLRRMGQLTTVEFVGKGRNCLDTRNNLARLVPLFREMGCSDLELLEEFLQAIFVFNAVFLHQILQGNVLEKCGVADVDIDQYAACSHANARIESPHGIQPVAQIKSLSPRSNRKCLPPNSSETVGGLGVMVEEDIQSLDAGTLVGKLGAHVGRSREVHNLSKGMSLDVLGPDLVLAGIGKGLVLTLSAIHDVEGDVVPFELLREDEGGLGL